MKSSRIYCIVSGDLMREIEYNERNDLTGFAARKRSLNHDLKIEISEESHDIINLRENIEGERYGS